LLWSVPRSWKGETCCILAGGPSLRGFDASVLVGRRVIAINDSWRLCPWADVHYYCDAGWWNGQIVLNRRSLDGSVCFLDMMQVGFWVKGSLPNEADHPHARTVRFTGQQGLETVATGLRHGSNSGYAAINLAYLFGAQRILLLGFDMRTEARRSHWHDEERPADFENQVIKRSFLPHFPTLVDPLAAAGVEVINCTAGSALKCWPHVPLAEALEKE
jgi:hypothetical protein